MSQEYFAVQDVLKAARNRGLLYWELSLIEDSGQWQGSVGNDDATYQSMYHPTRLDAIKAAFHMAIAYSEDS